MEKTAAGPITPGRLPAGPAGKFASLIRLNREERGNAIDEQVLDGLATALAAAEADESVCVILISGHGRDFCVGIDPVADERLRADPLWYPEFRRRAQGVFISLREAGKPVVVLVNGQAIRLGLEFALWCDFLYC